MSDTTRSKWIKASLDVVRDAFADGANDDKKRSGAAACRALLEALGSSSAPPLSETKPPPPTSTASTEPAAATAAPTTAPTTPTPPPAPDLITSLIDRFGPLVPPSERPRGLNIPMAPIPAAPPRSS